MPPSTPEEKTVSENERLFKEHRDIGQEKEELPDKDEVEKFLKLPSNKGQVTHLRKVYNEGVSDVEKRYKQNERDVKKFANSQQRMDTLHEVAEAEGEDDNLSELREKALDIYNNPNSTADEIMAARNDYHQEVFKINDKMWDEQKQKVEGAVQDIEEKIALAEEERDKFKRDKKKYDKKHREIVKLMGKRDKILSQVEKEEKLRLERAKSFSEEHLDVLKGGAKVQMQAQQAENEQNPGDTDQNPESTEIREANNDSQIKRNKKLYKIIAGILGGAGGALGGAAVIGTGSIVPIVLTYAGALVLHRMIKKDGKIPLVSSLLERNIAKYRDEIAGLGEQNPEKAEKERKLQTREKLRDSIQEYSKPLFTGAYAGLFIGGALQSFGTAGFIDQVFATTPVIAGSGAAVGGATTVGPEAKNWYVESRPATQVNLRNELNIDPTIIERLRTEGILAEETLPLTKKEGGKIGDLCGKFHHKVMQAKIPPENLNKALYVEKIREIFNKGRAGEDVNVEAMAQDVISTSSPNQ